VTPKAAAKLESICSTNLPQRPKVRSILAGALSVTPFVRIIAVNSVTLSAVLKSDLYIQKTGP